MRWLIAALILVAATVAYVGSPFVSRELDLHDEGLVLTNAAFLAQGLWPHRDFWTYYPPGQYLLLAGLFHLAGPSMVIGRLLFLVTLVTVIIASFWVLHQWTRHVVVAMLGAAFILCWYGLLWPAPLGIHTAMALLLATLGLQGLALRRQQAWPMALGGMTTALTMGVRHDVGAALLLASLFSWLMAAILRGAGLKARTFPAGAGWACLGGFCLVMIPAAVGLAAVAPWRAVVNDLVVYVLSRHLAILPVPCPLPLPAIRPFLHGSGGLLAWLLEAFQRLMLWYLPPAGMALGAGWLAWATWRRSRWGVWEQQGLTLLAVGWALLPLGLIRCDWVHRTYVVIPPLLWLTGLLWLGLQRLRGRPRRLLRWAAGGLLLAASAPRILHPAWGAPSVALALERARGIRTCDRRGARDVERLVRFLQRATRPDEAIYIATRFQGRILASQEVGLYFLSARPAGTRYAESWMSLLTDEHVQRTIIQDLEERGVRLLVLRALEPRELSLINGVLTPQKLEAQPVAPLLDAYVEERFERIAQVGPFELYRRSATPPEVSLDK